ncbi:hypothetical protein GCM10010121_000990 [Streptomyces brasiliensis]|uniref:Methyltransferase type 11 domain-containing protein n=2 Tax=Streptomyces brasiliensis TaxID=1954 RepID=A0A917JZE4_9ACTN|nr:hypothetical protein GCM10010121_000990 [Streptomyces brasiliensis]
MIKKAERARQSADDLVARPDAADDLPGVRELRFLSYELLSVQPGTHGTSVVDVGCGAGRAVAEPAERGATAAGVDPDERMIGVAGGGRPDGDYRIADACALPFADASLDGYRADEVFHEPADPERTSAEARHVLTPGGRIVLIGQDRDSFVIDSDDPALTRTLVHARADLTHGPRAAGRAGRRRLRARCHHARPDGRMDHRATYPSRRRPTVSGPADVRGRRDSAPARREATASTRPRGVPGAGRRRRTDRGNPVKG